MSNSTNTNLGEAVVFELARAVQTEWAAYVIVAEQTSPESVGARAQELSDILHIGKDSIHRRIAAIQFALANKLTPTQIIEWGQEATLSAHIKSRKAENIGKTVRLGYQVSGEVKQMFDEQMARIREMANIPTPEQFWDWLLSHLRDLTDEQIRHSAGGRGAA